MLPHRLLWQLPTIAVRLPQAKACFTCAWLCSNMLYVLGIRPACSTCARSWLRCFGVDLSRLSPCAEFGATKWIVRYSKPMCNGLGAAVWRQTVAIMSGWHLHWKIGPSGCIFQRTTAWSRQVLRRSFWNMVLKRVLFGMNLGESWWMIVEACSCVTFSGVDEWRGWAFEPNSSTVSSRSQKSTGCWRWCQSVGNLQGSGAASSVRI